MDLREVLVSSNENAKAKLGARELREVHRSDLGWPWEEGDRDIGGAI